jgi:hypothetical protein
MCNSITHGLQNKPLGLRQASLARRLLAFSLALMLMLGNVTVTPPRQSAASMLHTLTATSSIQKRLSFGLAK